MRNRRKYRRIRMMMSQFGVDDLPIMLTEDKVDKKDQGKPMVDLIVPEFILELAEVLTQGAVKYKPDNWQTIEKRRYIAALYRHLLAYHKGEKDDGESKLSHMAHVAANAMFIFWMDKVAPEKSKKLIEDKDSEGDKCYVPNCKESGVIKRGDHWYCAKHGSEGKVGNNRRDLGFSGHEG
jgi:hypothetical protein